MEPPPIFDQSVDARGLFCPYPLLRAKKGLKELTPGQVLLLISTDPATLEDVKSFVAQTGHQLLHMQQGENVYHFWIQKV